MLYNVEAIVVRTMDYGEGNKILTLFTKEYGRQSVMARGAKKFKSRLTAVSQLFTHGQFAYFRSGGMGTLNHGEIIAAHHRLRENLEMSAYSAYISELVFRLTEEDQAGDAYLFEQLRAAFDAIEEQKDIRIIVHLFEMKILMLSGYTPELGQCVSCGRPEGDFSFSAKLGGVLCARCRDKDSAAISADGKTIGLLKVFQQLDLRRLGAIAVKDETKQQISQILRRYMDVHLELQLKSRKFLDQMMKYDL